MCFFFFQAEDGIRDYKVTGVQTCALPILVPEVGRIQLRLVGEQQAGGWHGRDTARGRCGARLRGRDDGGELEARPERPGRRDAVVVGDRRAIQRQLIDLRGREHLLELNEVREILTDEGVARSEEHTSELQSPCNLV